MYQLPKTERLCSRKQIAGLMEEGMVLFHFPFKVFFALQPAAADAPCCQMAVNVPKRNFKRAVKRNLLKRRIREAFRLNKPGLYELLHRQQQQLTVFFHYVSPEILPYADLESPLQKVLGKLAKVVEDPAGASAAVAG